VHAPEGPDPSYPTDSAPHPTDSAPHPTDPARSDEDLEDDESSIAGQVRDPAGAPPGPASAPSHPHPAPAVHDLEKTGQTERLDHFLARELPAHSRAFIQRLIEDGHVTVSPSAREIKPSLRVSAGARIRVDIPPPRKLDLTPQDIPIRILHEDAHIAVIDKPALLAVHPAPDQSSHTLVNALLFRLRELSSIGGVERPGIVHRLDKETSGVLLVAKNDRAHQSLSWQFKERTVRKAYLAIVRGEIDEWEGHVERPIGKSYTHAKKQMVRSDGSGREAVTDYRVLEKYRGYAILEVYPKTGRTHQIRVHLASLRIPVACDKLYGREKRIFASDLRGEARAPGEGPIIERQALHAARITFLHPATREEMTFSAPLHPDMDALLRALETHRDLRVRR
jgi:23S rRNA pseudouridine1911/1915/1917 synthase